MEHSAGCCAAACFLSHVPGVIGAGPDHDLVVSFSGQPQSGCFCQLDRGMVSRVVGCYHAQGHDAVCALFGSESMAGHDFRFDAACFLCFGGDSRVVFVARYS